MKLIVIEESSQSLWDILDIKKNGVICSVGPRECSHPNILSIKCFDNKLVPQTKELQKAPYKNYSIILSNLFLDLSILHSEIRIDGIYFGVFIRELIISRFYRLSFIKNFLKLTKNAPTHRHFVIGLENKLPFPIDYSWGYRCNYLNLERQHLESVMSWLSTLGGAFSALGDYNVKFAERAGVTSYKQMIIACRLGDGNLVSRCWLYCSLSLIQKKRFKKAARIIKFVYHWVKSQPAGKQDFKIVNMCHGIWTKLKYEHNIAKSIKSSTEYLSLNTKI